MEAPFDLEKLVKDLAAFRGSVSFHLMNEPPLPPEVAEPLWTADDTVASVLEGLRRQYDAPEGGWTIYAPEAPDAQS